MPKFTIMATEIFNKKQMVAVVIPTGVYPWKGNPRAVWRTSYSIEFKNVESLTIDDVIFSHNNEKEVSELIEKLCIKNFKSSEGFYFGEVLNIGFYRCNAVVCNIDKFNNLILKKVAQKMVA
jgi:hypothetical protein